MIYELSFLHERRLHKSRKKAKKTQGIKRLDGGELLLAACSRMTDAFGPTNNQGPKSQKS